MLTNQIDIRGRFERITTILEQYLRYWSYRPFDHLDIAWRAENQSFARAVDRLRFDQIEQLEANAGTMWQRFAEFLPDLTELHEICLLERYPPRTAAANRRLARYVPGRKWLQIEAFAGSIPFGSAPVIEWCAGKGHLGRLITVTHDLPVTSIEIDNALCEHGASLTADWGQQADQSFLILDALSETALSRLGRADHVVALHACGNLHIRLLEAAAVQRPRALSLSPCCYHRISGEVYQPLSAPGRQRDLHLHRHQLKLPLNETVTASGREVRLRHREVDWRLGFDLIQRDLTGISTYLEVPSVNDAILGQDFKSFCHWAAKRWDLALPHLLDFDHYEELGQKRRQVNARMEVVRHLFRRPLEMWLVFDRSIFLIENGYRVQIGEFCEREHTPRNILIHAERQARFN